MRLRYALVCAACLACGAALYADGDRVPLQENPYSLDPSRACGCYCLKFLDASFGGSAEYDRIARMCSPGPQGVTFETLRNVAVKLGYHVRPVKATLHQLCAVADPAIVHLDKADGPDHYVVWMGWDAANRKALVYSPPGILDYQDLQALADYSGNAMIFSKTPLPDSIAVTPAITRQQIAWNSVGLLLLLATTVYMCRPRLRSRFPWFACLAVVSMMAAGSIGCGGSRPATAATPTETPRDIDLGEVGEGTELKYTFVVSNVSDVPFRILAVEKSCSCQTVGVEVGRTVDSRGVLTVPYQVPNDTNAAAPAARLKIKTDSTHESLREIVLSLRAKVKPRIRVVPPQVVFGTVYDGVTPPQRQIRLESEIPGLIERFEKAASSRGLVSTSIDSTSPGVIVANISLADNLPHGDANDTITFSFRGETGKPLVIDVRAKRVGAVQAIPSSLAVESSGTSKKLRVRFKSGSGKSFAITKLDLPSFCKAEVDSAEPSAVHDVTLLCSPDQMDKGSSECAFHTDLSAKPVVLPLRVN